MFKTTSSTLLRLVGLTALCSLTACSHLSNLMNPFYEPPSEVALLGEKNDRALNDTKQKEDSAREALEAMASYRRTHEPQPVNPVVQPAMVRLMWVPDHLNKHGDLVPAHYYYLKVLEDRWAVSDAFEMEAQLNGPRGAAGVNASSDIPYVYTDEQISR